MKRILNKITILAVFVLAFACKDDSLDPFRFNELKKGSLLALRGDDGSAGSLDPDQNFFFKDILQTTDEFHYVADFISEDQSLLQSIDVYARIGTGTRAKVATVDASGWTIPTGGNSKQGEVVVSRAAILGALNITTPTDLKRTDIIVESDIVLTDGSIVPAEAIVNAGLFAASAFFPAHALNYYAEESADFVPVATTKLAGEVVKNADGKVTSRPVFPLKAGSKDTLYITYDQNILNTPSVSFSNQVVTDAPVGASGLALVKVSNKVFYTIVEAEAGYTGAVTATVTGAQANTFGPTLTQDAKTQTVNVDNTQPLITSSSTGTRIGPGQLVTITINFNERMSGKSANAILATITDPNDKLKPVTDAAMTVAANGLSASLVYLFELQDVNDPAVHGPLTLSYSGGADEAGNTVNGGVSTGGLTVDVGTPPAPSVTLIAPHDLGTQIRWRWTQGTDPVNNPGGSTTGTVYFIAVNSDTTGQVAFPAPVSVAFDADLNAIWTMPEDPNSDTDPKAKVAIRQAGTVPITLGNSGTSGALTTIFTPFTANRSFIDDAFDVDPLNDVVRGMDIYAVFRGSTGNVSAITKVASNVVMQ